MAYPQPAGTSTLELWDFGVPTDAFDWSRLPAADEAGAPAPTGALAFVGKLLRRARRGVRR